jgi:hypothetical protein
VDDEERDATESISKHEDSGLGPDPDPAWLHDPTKINANYSYSEEKKMFTHTSTPELRHTIGLCLSGPP